MQLSLPQPTRWDVLSRYLLGRAGQRFFPWALRQSPQRISFRRWLAAALTLAGAPERLCDGVAELIDHDKGGVPVAALLEVQTTPDATMPERLMLAGGLAWLLLKPTPLPGDRYELLGVVVNLTGVGDAERTYEIGNAKWVLRPVEVNLETLDADGVLDEIERGEAPAELLALIPLMRGGDDPAIIARWRAVVGAEPDLQRRADYALARVFAERVGRAAAWHNALEGLTMIESPSIAELLSDHAAKTRAETRAEDLLRVLRKRHGELPEDLSTAIRACVDLDQLDSWFDLALEKRSLAQFRRRAGL